MVQNSAEYGMLLTYGEGFEILQAAEEYDLNLHAIARMWKQSSVVHSWILKLAEDAFKSDNDLETIKGYVADSGEGHWTVQRAIDTNVPVPVITLSLLELFRSRQDKSFTAKVIVERCNEFSGYAVKTNA
jgi:6-phosphogluconate dehydrogenase